jgi:hypothetical protein
MRSRLVDRPSENPSMGKHAWVLPLIIVTVVVTIKVRVKR